MKGRDAVRVVTAREIRERAREKSFLASAGFSLLIVIVVVVIAAIADAGPTSYTVAVADPQLSPVAEQAGRQAGAADIRLTVRELSPQAVDAALADGDVDAALVSGGLRFQEDPEEELEDLLQSANSIVGAERALAEAGVAPDRVQDVLAPAALAVSSAEDVDPDADAKAGYAFVVSLILYGQLFAYAFLIASGIVEEKASRVIEVILAAIRPNHLLAGKVIGLGVLGVVNLLIVAAVGLVSAVALGLLDLDGDVWAATALALVWFLAGYAFYGALFACAGALVPRQEELGASTTPLSILIVASFLVAITANSDPDGTLAKVASFIPATAPMVMPARVVTGDATTLEAIASLAIAFGAAAALIPVAARIYAGGVLQTGQALKLRQAWRGAGR